MDRIQWYSDWRGKLLVALLSVCATTVVAYVVAEILIRSTVPYETPDTLRRKSLEYEATLFSVHAFPQMAQEKGAAWGWHWEAAINPRGYRGREFAVPKPEGVLRIVVLGGSGAFDIFAPKGRDWPHLVEERLRDRGYSNVEVINGGTPGHATFDVLGRLYSEIWMFEPDIVLVYNAWNDIKYFGWLNPDKSLLRGVRPVANAEGFQGMRAGNPFIYYTGPLDELFSNSQLYVRLRWRYWSWRLGPAGLEGLRRPGGKRPSPALRNSYPHSYSDWGPRQYELNLRLITDAVKDLGATPILLTQARLVSASNSEEYRRRIRYDLVNLSPDGLVRAFADCDRATMNVARAEGVDVLDLSALFSGRGELFVDHIHTSVLGSEAIAEAVAEFLLPVVKDRSAGLGTG